MSLNQRATITRIENGRLYLSICTPAACDACKAHSTCSSMGGGKEIELYDDGRGRAVGDEVTLNMKPSQGAKAVLLAYLVPVGLIVGLLVVLQSFNFSEIASGAIVLGVVVVYYIGLRVFRSRIESELTIVIE